MPVLPGILGRTLASCLMGAGALLAAGGPVRAQSADVATATESLRVTIAEWRQEDGAYRAARTAGRISAREAEDYAGFVANLRLRVLEQCEVVRGLGGEEAVQGFDCVRTGAQPRAVAVVPPSAVLTDEERKAALSTRLNRLEGEIDEDLQKRQQEIRQTASRTPARGSGAGQGAGGAAGGTAAGGTAAAGTGSGSWSPPDPAPAGDRSGAGGERSASTGDNGSRGGGLPGSASTPAKPGTAGREVPRDGGVDDDVVARQLREAAEKETDPVLKQKLWAEYEKYREARRK